MHLSKGGFVSSVALLTMFVAGAGLAQASSLSIATNYNVFLGGNFTSSNTDVAGRVAVGGNLAVANFGLVGRLNSSANGTDTLIVGGNLNAPNTQLYYGNAYAGSVSTAPSLANPSQQSIRTTGADPVNFASTMDTLQAYAYMLGGIVTDNSALTLDPWHATINATTNGLTVVTVNSALFANNRDLNINVGPNSTLLINVVGSSFSGPNASIHVNGQGLNGDNTTSAVGQILWNMPGVTGLSLTNSGWLGTILAPQASVTAPYSQFSGSLIAQNYNGNAEFHLNNFTGTLPESSSPTPEPDTFAMMGLGLIGTAIAARRYRRNRAQ